MRRVLIDEPDLDTCGCGLILGVTREDKIEVIKGEAKEEDLKDPQVFCIEVGGSGQIELNNFDHHEKGIEGSAIKQAFQVYKDLYGPDERLKLERLVEYIDTLDVRGPHALREKSTGRYPTLSDVFSGMLLKIENPVEQFHKGIEILKIVIEKNLDPFGAIEIDGFEEYVQAKVENDRRITEAIEKAKWTVTKSGYKLAYLETQFIGAPGALYRVGAQVVAVLNPHYNGVRKFTIAGNDIKVDSLLEKLNSVEPGWGGPASGTIIGSPKEGSRLSLKEVVNIVREEL